MFLLTDTVLVIFTIGAWVFTDSDTAFNILGKAVFLGMSLRLAFFGFVAFNSR